jgi:hypothetical protein
MIDVQRGIARRWGVLRLLCAIGACGLVPPNLAFSGTGSADSSCVSATATNSLVTPVRGFRLGTAAAPFGPAAAVADFNDDGVADFAVVDRIVSSEPQHRYAVQIAVSNALEQRFILSSPHEAVTVVVEDVDHDDDLDVVVTRPLLPEVLAVWVNDGFGRFTPMLRNAPMRLGSRELLSADHSVASPPPALAAERALPGCGASGRRLPNLEVAHGAIVDGHAHADRILALTAIDSRGPPSLVLL